MANSLLTISMITREAIDLFRNSNAFIMSIDRQYDDQFARTGAKIGSQLRIRLPNDYTVRTGNAASIQDTTEQQTILPLATIKGVDVSFNGVDRTLSLDDYSKRVLSPMINNLAGAVAADVMSGAEAGTANFVANTDSGGNVLSPTTSTILTAGASLRVNSAPLSDWMLVTDPFTDARSVASLSGQFNPSQRISEQYQSGQMKNALGFDWASDQTVIKHTTGSFTAGTVNGANQTGNTILVNAITGTLNVGDIITFAGVFAVNRVTKQSTGMLRQFVLTAAAANGATQLSVYPALTPAVAGVAVQYQTVTASPANSAAITLATLPGSVYRKNLAFAPEAITLATADLEIPGGVQEASRKVYDNISMRMVTAYAIGTNETITRLDILYGYCYIRPEWVVAVADAI